MLIPYLIICFYLLATLLVGFLSYQQQENTAEDYFLANRKLGNIVLFFTLIATNFSSFFFLGFAGEGYRIGISYYPMMAFGTGFAALSFYYIGYQVWKLGKQYHFITPAELIDFRFNNPPLKVLFLAVMVIFTLPYLALQPIGAGYLLENLTNGQIPYFFGATFLTIIIVIYVLMGGMRSVALTDVLQGILMFILMITAFVVIAHNLGGFANITKETYTLKPELFSRSGVGDFFTEKKWFSFIALWSLTLPMFPQMFMRFYTAKTSQSLKISTLLYPVITGVLFICPVMIGVWGNTVFPSLEGKEADQILPMMLSEYTPLWLNSIIMVGALASFMSTLDSQLLSLSSIITRDIYLPYIHPQASLKQQTLIGRIVIIILAIIGLIIAYQPPSTIFIIATQTFTGLTVLFPTVIAALYSKNIKGVSCLVSIIVGELIVIGFQFNWLPSYLTFGFLPVIPVVVISSSIIVVGGIVNGRANNG
ncbi:MAG: sodium:solute symporter family protein [Crocosphaera sp.]|nr:sodium:solute symporter family protein [Crocosphaera sp.]